LWCPVEVSRPGAAGVSEAGRGAGRSPAVVWGRVRCGKPVVG
jgi:hypothetical protein